MPISRAELPEEFFDRTSSQLLPQPEPQYTHAGAHVRPGIQNQRWPKNPQRPK